MTSALSYDGFLMELVKRGLFNNVSKSSLTYAHLTYRAHTKFLTALLFDSFLPSLSAAQWRAICVRSGYLQSSQLHGPEVEARERMAKQVFTTISQRFARQAAWGMKGYSVFYSANVFKMLDMRALLSESHVHRGRNMPGHGKRSRHSARHLQHLPPSNIRPPIQNYQAAGIDVLGEIPSVAQRL